MLERLKKKWNVGGWRLLIILMIFALSGSATAFLAKTVTGYLEIEILIVETFVYFILLTLTWPLTVLIISIPFGQFAFFSNYLSIIGNKFFTRKKN